MKKSYFNLTLVILSLCLAACSNFANSALFKTQLDESISYINSPYVSVQISAQSKDCYESILPPENIYEGKYKKTDKINLAFEPAEGYKFLQWTCTPEGAVSFEDPTAKTTVATIISDTESIVITPECNLVPKVVSYYPSSSTIVYSKDSVISVIFNTKLDSTSFATASDPFKNIVISSESNTINKSYFLSPEFITYDNQSELLIKPNIQSFSDFFEKHNSEYIYVTIALSKLKDKNQNSLFAEDLSFVYKVDNTVLDTKGPEIIPKDGFKIFRTKEGALSNNTNEVVTSYIKCGTYNDGSIYFTSDEYGSNSNNGRHDSAYYYAHNDQLVVGPTVWLYAQIKDENFNNLQKIIITEHNLNNYSNYNKDNFPYIKTIYTPGSESISFDPKTSLYTFLTEYKIQTTGKNILQFTIEVFDGSNTSTIEAFDVLCNTTLPEPKFVRIPPEIKGNTTSENISLYIFFDTYTITIGNAPSFNYNTGALDSEEFTSNNRKFKIHFDEILYSYDNINFAKVSNFQNDYINKAYGIYNTKYYPCAKVSIQRDCTKDLYIKAIYSDFLGNKKEITQKIPKNINILNSSLDSNNNITLTLSETPNTSCLLFYSKDGSELSTVYKNNIQNTNEYLIFNSEKTFSFKLSNINRSSTSTIENGVYNFYVLPTNFDANKKFINLTLYVNTFDDFQHNIFSYLNEHEETSSTYEYYKDNSSSKFFLIPLCGAVGDFYPVYKGITPPDEQIPDSAVPSSFTISETSNGVNSSTYTVKLSYPTGFKQNTNYFYLYELTDKTDNNSVEIFTENPFICKSNHNYQIKVIVKDKYGHSKTSSYSLEKQMPKENIPPYWPETLTYNFSDKNFNSFYITSVPTTVNSLEYNSRIYYIINTNETATLEDFNNNPFEAELNNGKYQIYYHSSSSKNFHFLVKDFEKNYTIRNFKISKNDYPFTLTVLPYESNKVFVYLTGYAGSGNNFQTLYLQPYNSESNEWSTVEIKTKVQKQNPKNTSETVDCVVLDPGLYNSFIKIAPDCKFPGTITADNTSDLQYENITYIHPKTIASKKNVTLKALIPNGKNYEIITDSPVFVHTLTSPNNPVSIQQWERYGIEVQKIYSEGGFTFTPPGENLLGIENKYYYTSIVHFADGTAKMIDVKQKLQ